MTKNKSEGEYIRDNDKLLTLGEDAIVRLDKAKMLECNCTLLVKALSKGVCLCFKGAEIHKYTNRVEVVAQAINRSNSRAGVYIDQMVATDAI